MKVEFVIDAPSRRKWFVSTLDHPISQWARPGFYPKKVATYMLEELGLFRDEIRMILLIAERHPSRMAEIKHEH